MSIQGKKVTLHEMALRDGMHPKQHQISIEQMTSIATALDAAGMPLIEVTHGDGLGGDSVNYGFAAHTDEQYLKAVIPLMKHAKVSALLLPGIGTVDHLRMAHEVGVHTIRVATHCTEADVSEQHITLARKLGMDTVGFLMMSHMNSPEGLVKQAKLMEGYGANCIYVTDSAGHMLPEDVRALLVTIQHELFNLGGELAIPGSELVKTEAVARLDEAIGHHNAALPRLAEFILPAGTRSAALAHQSRTVARRAERTLVALGAAETLNRPPQHYLNRLSDLLFVLARVLNRANLDGKAGDDVYWKSERLARSQPG
jgi:ATP:cob(I)alamin adenosyltransferase